MAKGLLITGAGGFVGGHLVTQALNPQENGREIFAFSTKPAPIQKSGLHWITGDPFGGGELEAAFQRARPDAVIHAAAIANIDSCEANPETAHKVNVEFTRRIAELSVREGAKLVFVSTDTIFDGERGRYTEEDAPGPVNVYAKTKVEAEAVVRASGAKWAIGRICLVMGIPVFGQGNTFLPKMIETLRSGKTMHVPTAEVRSPIDVVTAARALIELASEDRTRAREGVFHLAGNDTLPRVQMARRIARALGCPEELIRGVEVANIEGRAQRPRDVSLDNSKARQVLKTEMLGLEAGLALALDAIKVKA